MIVRPCTKLRLCYQANSSNEHARVTQFMGKHYYRNVWNVFDFWYDETSCPCLIRQSQLLLRFCHFKRPPSDQMSLNSKCSFVAVTCNFATPRWYAEQRWLYLQVVVTFSTPIGISQSYDLLLIKVLLLEESESYYLSMEQLWVCYPSLLILSTLPYLVQLSLTAIPRTDVSNGPLSCWPPVRNILTSSGPLYHLLLSLHGILPIIIFFFFFFSSCITP